jgi:hypothetical protein
MSAQPGDIRDTVAGYLWARRSAERWIAEHEAPMAIARPAIATFLRALQTHAKEQIPVDNIMREQLKKYINSECDRYPAPSRRYGART